MTAHQYEFIKMGFNNFLTVGDVYRRDSIDSTHYPVFHQLDGVKLFSPLEVRNKNFDIFTLNTLTHTHIYKHYLKMIKLLAFCRGR